MMQDKRKCTSRTAANVPSIKAALRGTPARLLSGIDNKPALSRTQFKPLPHYKGKHLLGKLKWTCPTQRIIRDRYWCLKPERNFKTLTTRILWPIAFAGRLLLNLARTIPLFPWARVTLPQMTRVLLGLPPGVAVILQTTYRIQFTSRIWHFHVKHCIQWLKYQLWSKQITGLNFIHQLIFNNKPLSIHISKSDRALLPSVLTHKKYFLILKMLYIYFMY